MATVNGVTGTINAPSWQAQALAIASHKVIYDTTSVLTDSSKDFVVSVNPSAG
jgi:hypothetical protein